MVAETSQRGDGRCGFRVVPTKVQFVPDRGPIPRFGNGLENRTIVRPDDLRVAQHVQRERRRLRISHEPADAVHLLRRFRQDVRLAIVHHLQPMLDPAQEPIGFIEHSMRSLLQMTGLRQARHRQQRRPYP